ncbi:hypothetical protein IMZ08_08000 [Bacillus luteolus]|uniref:Uncharacterized protein n=1 Tax=Litchfieldia luteola TaxID=682179 RepID=A0ABR9QHM3_9BACI|nr:hypothetical protein [Cytobacillus luteolus]MBE4907992.1 hypothetical protein [Cytobacillus luteolus]MBP1942774.1 hypothetical protein [Cytobacillus luteolus]
MDQKNNSDNANLKINQYLDDMPSQSTLASENVSKTEEANLKINNQFYKDHDREVHPNDLPPTYIYNNTPAIQINNDDD